MADLFTIDVVRAVSDWQRGPQQKAKDTRGRALKEVMLRLPEYFRQCDGLCYRQECHQKDRTFQVLIDDKLPETIASWTTELEVAKAFKGGVTWGDEGRSIILTIKPPEHAVVANFERLYNDPEFQKSLVRHGPEIAYFYNGAGKYGNTQKEVVLELGSLCSANIYSYGGYSPQAPDLIAEFRKIYGKDPDDQEIAQIAQNVNQPWWLSETGTRSVISRVIPGFLERVTSRKAIASAACVTTPSRPELLPASPDQRCPP